MTKTQRLYDEIDYLLSREIIERDAARTSADPTAARLHGDMASIYARRRSDTQARLSAMSRRAIFAED